MKANNLIIAFFAESPPCSAQTCPEMRASEWQYLCAVHDPPKSCCAIDYCCHTLDWATNILTSPKYFPSRLMLGGENVSGGVGASMRHLTNIFRRVYRIFAHAWFQHRGVFWQVEGHDGLYIFFKTVCDVYQLIPEDNYTIPVEAEGADVTLDTPIVLRSPEKMRVLSKQHADAANQSNSSNESSHNVDDSSANANVAQTTRRHKHTPSTGTHVTSIAEGQEEEEPSTTGVPGPEIAQAEPVAASTRHMPKLDLSTQIPMTEIEYASDPTPMPKHTDPFATVTPVAMDAPPSPKKAEKETEKEKLTEDVGETTVINESKAAAVAAEADIAPSKSPEKEQADADKVEKAEESAPATEVTFSAAADADEKLQHTIEDEGRA